VDPDRWEFAHVSFLRGQTHLMSQIVRRSSGGNGGGKRNKDDVVCTGNVNAVDEDAVATEVVRLRREQRAIEEQVAAMWRRVQETERRPKQMLAFLIKVAGDPQVLRRLVSGAGGAGAGGAGGSDAGFAACTEPDDGADIKRARLLLDAGCGGGGGSDGGGVDFGGFYSTGGGEDDVGFCGDYLQPPPYVFPVNSGY
jgi:heat shock transcription factor